MENLGGYLKTIILTLLFISCEESTEIESIKGLIANAGEDITIPASSYVVFDASGSCLGENPNFNNLWLEWIQDVNNPEEVSLFSGDNLTRAVGFLQEGTYKFYLVINNGTDTSNTDEKVVTVFPREKSIIEDPYLEIHIRYLLKKQDGIITEEDLINLDSLVNYNVPLGLYNITNLNGIEYCLNLKHINLNLESISDINPLRNLIQLNFLSINQNKILSDVSPIVNLVNLEFLDIETNDISDIGMLGTLKKLKSFNIMYNEKIDDINVVGNFLELERLLLSHQNIQNISCIKNLKHLRDLFAPKCNINDISPLENLTNLDWLFLIYNNITDISPLRNLTKLRKLFLSTNNINSIEILEFLPNLQTIALVDNKIENILPLVKNININNGDDVYLMDNPLSEKAINEYIPELQKRGVLVFW